MDGAEITVDESWITVEGLTLTTLTIPQEHALALSRAIRKAVKEQEGRGTMKKQTRQPDRAIREQHAEMMRARCQTKTMVQLLKVLTPEQKRLAVQAHKRHVAACLKIGEQPAGLLKFLEKYRNPEQVASLDWDRETIREGFCRVRYDQYVSGREAA